MAYRVDGTRLLENGVEIQMQGVNFIGMETQDAVIHGLWKSTTIPEYVAKIKAAGFNQVRLPIGPKALDPNFYPKDDIIGNFQGSKNASLKGKSAPEILAMLVQELENAGIRYVFDWHYLEKGVDPNNPNDFKIPDLWYTAAYSEARWLSDLVTLAKFFKGKKNFIGIDIKNEPKFVDWGTGSAKDWKLACDKAFAAIDAVNSDIVLFLAAWDMDTSLGKMLSNPPNIPQDRYALTTHIYFADVWGAYVNYFGDYEKSKQIWDKAFGTVARKKLVWIGEWGGFYGLKKPLDRTAQDQFVDYLLSLGVTPHHSYWLFGPNGWDTGGILLDDWKTVREDKLKLIARLAFPLKIVAPTVGVEYKSGDVLRHKAGGPAVCVVRPLSDPMICEMFTAEGLTEVQIQRSALARWEKV